MKITNSFFSQNPLPEKSGLSWLVKLFAYKQVRLSAFLFLLSFLVVLPALVLNIRQRTSYQGQARDIEEVDQYMEEQQEKMEQQEEEEKKAEEERAYETGAASTTTTTTTDSCGSPSCGACNGPCGGNGTTTCHNSCGESWTESCPTDACPVTGGVVVTSPKTCTVNCPTGQHCQEDELGGTCVGTKDDSSAPPPAAPASSSTPGGCGPDERCQAYYQALKSCQDQGGGGCDVAAGEAWARVEEDNAQKARRGDVSAQKKAADWTVVQKARDQGLDVSALSTDEVKAKFYGTLPEDKKIPCADQACLAGDVARNSCRDYNSKSGLNLDCEVWAHQEYDRVKAAVCSDPVACKDIESHEKMTPQQIKDLLAQKSPPGTPADSLGNTSIPGEKVKSFCVENKQTGYISDGTNYYRCDTGEKISKNDLTQLASIFSSSSICQGRDPIPYKICMENQKPKIISGLDNVILSFAQKECASVTSGDRQSDCIKGKQAEFSSGAGLANIANYTTSASSRCAGLTGDDLAYCMTTMGVPVFGVVTADDLLDKTASGIAESLCAGEDSRYMDRCRAAQKQAAKDNILTNIASQLAVSQCASQIKSADALESCKQSKISQLQSEDKFTLISTAKQAKLLMETECQGQYGLDLKICMSQTGLPLFGTPTTLEIKTVVVRRSCDSSQDKVIPVSSGSDFEYYDCSKEETVYVSSQVKDICQTQDGPLPYSACRAYQDTIYKGCQDKGVTEGQELDFCVSQQVDNLKAETNRQLSQSQIAEKYCTENFTTPLEINGCIQSLTGFATVDYNIDTGVRSQDLAPEAVRSNRDCNGRSYLQDNAGNVYSCFTGNPITDPREKNLAQSQLQAEAAKLAFADVGPAASEIADLSITGQDPKDYCSEKNQAFSYFKFNDNGEAKTGYCFDNAGGFKDGYYGLISAGSGQIAKVEQKEYTYYGLPVELKSDGKYEQTDAGYKKYCEDNPYGQFSVSWSNEDLGGQSSYGRCDDLGNYQWVNSPYADLETMDLIAAKPGDLLGKQKTSTGAYIRDQAMVDGISDNFLRAMADQADPLSLGAKLPDCSNRSGNENTRDSDGCKRFRANLKEWMDMVGVPHDSYPGDCKGQEGTGWWNTNQCNELSNFVAFETNASKRGTRAVYNPFDLLGAIVSAPLSGITGGRVDLVPIGSVKMERSDLRTMAFKMGQMTAAYVGVSLIGGAGAGPATGVLFAGTAFVDSKNAGDARCQMQNNIGIPCYGTWESAAGRGGCNFIGEKLEDVGLNCADSNSSAVVAVKMQHDLAIAKQSFAFHGGCDLNGAVDQSCLQRVNELTVKAQNQTLSETEQKEWQGVMDYYAKYLLNNGSGANSVVQANVEWNNNKGNLIMTGALAPLAFIPIMPKGAIPKIVSLVPTPIKSTVVKTGEVLLKPVQFVADRLPAGHYVSSPETLDRLAAIGAQNAAPKTPGVISKTLQSVGKYIEDGGLVGDIRRRLAGGEAVAPTVPAAVPVAKTPGFGKAPAELPKPTPGEFKSGEMVVINPDYKYSRLVGGKWEPIDPKVALANGQKSLLANTKSPLKVEAPAGTPIAAVPAAQPVTPAAKTPSIGQRFSGWLQDNIASRFQKTPAVTVPDVPAELGTNGLARVSGTVNKVDQNLKYYRVVDGKPVEISAPRTGLVSTAENPIYTAPASRPLTAAENNYFATTHPSKTPIAAAQPAKAPAVARTQTPAPAPKPVSPQEQQLQLLIQKQETMAQRVTTTQQKVDALGTAGKSGTAEYRSAYDALELARNDLKDAQAEVQALQRQIALNRPVSAPAPAAPAEIAGADLKAGMGLESTKGRYILDKGDAVSFSVDGKSVQVVNNGKVVFETSVDDVLVYTIESPGKGIPLVKPPVSIPKPPSHTWQSNLGLAIDDIDRTAITARITSNEFRRDLQLFIDQASVQNLRGAALQQQIENWIRNDLKAQGILTNDFFSRKLGNAVSLAMSDQTIAGRVRAATIAAPLPPQNIQQPVNALKKSTTTKLSGRDPDQILAKTEIHATSYRGQDLTVDILNKNGLKPAVKVEVNGTTVWFSRPYELGDGRLAVIAYTPDGRGGFVARSFYRSNSQGVWRYLPQYTTDRGGFIDWFGKGLSEESITAPTEIQQVLANTALLGTPLKVTNPDLIFAGTARNMDSAYQITYILSVDNMPTSLKGNFYSPRGAKIPPGQLLFTDPGEAPNFAKFVTSYKQQTSLYGDINIEVFESNNGQLRYAFARDSRGRAWVASVEQGNGELSAVGVNKQWVKGGDLTTPAFEYTSQTGGYGNNRVFSGSYVDMYDNYLSKVPVIKEYQANVLARTNGAQPAATTQLPRAQSLPTFSQAVGGTVGQGSRVLFGESSTITKAADAVENWIIGIQRRFGTDVPTWAQSTGTVGQYEGNIFQRIQKALSGRQTESLGFRVSGPQLNTAPLEGKNATLNDVINALQKDGRTGTIQVFDQTGQPMRSTIPFDPANPNTAANQVAQIYAESRGAQIRFTPGEAGANGRTFIAPKTGQPYGFVESMPSVSYNRAVYPTELQSQELKSGLALTDGANYGHRVTIGPKDTFEITDAVTGKVVALKQENGLGPAFTANGNGTFTVKAVDGTVYTTKAGTKLNVISYGTEQGGMGNGMRIAIEPTAKPPWAPGTYPLQIINTGAAPVTNNQAQAPTPVAAVPNNVAVKIQTTEGVKPTTEVVKLDTGNYAARGADNSLKYFDPAGNPISAADTLTAAETAQAKALLPEINVQLPVPTAPVPAGQNLGDRVKTFFGNLFKRKPAVVVEESAAGTPLAGNQLSDVLTAARADAQVSGRTLKVIILDGNGKPQAGVFPLNQELDLANQIPLRAGQGVAIIDEEGNIVRSFKSAGAGQVTGFVETTPKPKAVTPPVSPQPQTSGPSFLERVRNLFRRTPVEGEIPANVSQKIRGNTTAGMTTRSEIVSLSPDRLAARTGVNGEVMVFDSQGNWRVTASTAERSAARAAFAKIDAARVQPLSSTTPQGTNLLQRFQTGWNNFLDRLAGKALPEGSIGSLNSEVSTVAKFTKTPLRGNNLTDVLITARSDAQTSDQLLRVAILDADGKPMSGVAAFRLENELDITQQLARRSGQGLALVDENGNVLRTFKSGGVGQTAGFVETTPKVSAPVVLPSPTPDQIKLKIQMTQGVKPESEIVSLKSGRFAARGPDNSIVYFDTQGNRINSGLGVLTVGDMDQAKAALPEIVVPTTPAAASAPSQNLLKRFQTGWSNFLDRLAGGTVPKSINLNSETGLASQTVGDLIRDLRSTPGQIRILDEAGNQVGPIFRSNVANIETDVVRQLQNGGVKVEFIPQGQSVPSRVFIPGSNGRLTEQVLRPVSPVQPLDQSQTNGGWLQNLWNRITGRGRTTTSTPTAPVVTPEISVVVPNTPLNGNRLTDVLEALTLDGQVGRVQVLDAQGNVVGEFALGTQWGADINLRFQNQTGQTLRFVPENPNVVGRTFRSAAPGQAVGFTETTRVPQSGVAPLTTSELQGRSPAQTLNQLRPQTDVPANVSVKIQTAEGVKPGSEIVSLKSGRFAARGPDNSIVYFDTQGNRINSSLGVLTVGDMDQAKAALPEIVVPTTAAPSANNNWLQNLWNRITGRSAATTTNTTTPVVEDVARTGRMFRTGEFNGTPLVPGDAINNGSMVYLVTGDEQIYFSDATNNVRQFALKDVKITAENGKITIQKGTSQPFEANLTSGRRVTISTPNGGSLILDPTVKTPVPPTPSQNPVSRFVNYLRNLFKRENAAVIEVPPVVEVTPPVVGKVFVPGELTQTKLSVGDVLQNGPSKYVVQGGEKVVFRSSSNISSLNNISPDWTLDEVVISVNNKGQVTVTRGSQSLGVQGNQLEIIDTRGQRFVINGQTWAHKTYFPGQLNGITLKEGNIVSDGVNKIEIKGGETISFTAKSQINSLNNTPQNWKVSETKITIGEGGKITLEKNGQVLEVKENSLRIIDSTGRSHYLNPTVGFEAPSTPTSVPQSPAPTPAPAAPSPSRTPSLVPQTYKMETVQMANSLDALSGKKNYDSRGSYS